MIETIDKSMYDPSMPKLYRIGFADEMEYRDFIKAGTFPIVKKK